MGTKRLVHHQDYKGDDAQASNNYRPGIKAYSAASGDSNATRTHTSRLPCGENMNGGRFQGDFLRFVFVCSVQ
jgi:hypothetical protein